MNADRVRLVGVLAITLMVNAIGIRWGVPSMQRAMAIFETRQSLNDFLPAMEESREELTEMVQHAWDMYSPGRNANLLS